MLFQMMKKLIQNNNYTVDSIMKKIDVFLATDRITKNEYESLIAIMGGEVSE